MRTSSTVSEAWRNVVSGTSNVVVIALVLGILSAILCGVDLLSVATITSHMDAYKASGATIQIYEAPGRVNATACESLNSAQSVRAGAMRPAAKNYVARALPGSPLPTYEVTPHLIDLLTNAKAGQRGTGVAISRDVATALGLRIGGTITLSGGEVVVAAIYEFPVDGRLSTLSYAVLVPVTSEANFDECWADAWPQSDRVTALLRATLVPSISSQVDQPHLGQLNASLGDRFDGGVAFATRIGQYFPAFGGVAAFLIVLISTRGRKVELASARHSGVDANEQWLMTLLESVGWIVAIWVATLPPAAWFVSRAAGEDRLSYLGLACVTPATISIGALLGMAVAVASCRERLLFANVKSRR